MDIMNKKLWVVNQVTTLLAENKGKVYELSNTHRFILIALAHFCNNKTKRCWPSIKKLSQMCSLSERTIKDTLKTLEKLDIITISYVEDEHGAMKRAMYEMHIEKLYNNGADEAANMINEIVTQEKMTVLKVV